MSVLVPAVLPSSLEDLREKIARFARIPSVRRIQIDVVDGKFASPASWPYTKPMEFRNMRTRGGLLPFCERIEYEIDLMCLDADDAAERWLSLGATRLTFHAESISDLRRFFHTLKDRCGIGAGFVPGLLSFGLAINIASDLSIVELFLPEIDYVQFMGIAQIGRQGEPFDRRVFEKIRVFRNRHRDFPIQVDGGISLEHAKKLISLQVDTLVVGSHILKAKDPAGVLAAFDALQKPYGV